MDKIQSPEGIAAVAGIVTGMIAGGMAGKKINTKVGNSKAVDNFIKKNVHPNFQKNVNAFKSDIKVTKLAEDITVYRYHGGSSSGTSYWYTPKKTPNPVADLALPKGNTCTHVNTCIIPKGTTVLEGTVARNFGQPGGGYQYYVPDPSVVKLF